METLMLMILAAMVSYSAQAEMIGIHDIWAPERADESYLILGSDGKVYEVAPAEHKLLSDLYQALDNGNWVEVKLTGNRLQSDDEIQTIFYVKVFDIDSAEMPQQAEEEKIVLDPMYGFTPSYIQSFQEANQLFRTMKLNTRAKSQCYNRAHVWSYELWKNHGIKSKKIWMFFTRKYIREFRFKWWFHVTPAVVVAGDDMAIDRRYSKQPLSLNSWKNIFIRNKAHCPVVTRYGQYYLNQQKNYCYHIKSSMYFWQPYQIENLEKVSASVRSEWVTSEINIAYNDALTGSGTGRPRRSWWRRIFN